MFGKSKSVGVLNLQKSISSSQHLNTKNEFVPFINQRKLGKLIVDEGQKREAKNSKYTINEINFKNFKQIYNKQHLIELAKYSRMTRNSQQQDLISDRPDWKLNQVQTKQKRAKSQSNITIRNCCTQVKHQYPKSLQKFDKIDEDVYKKISVSRPSEHLKNPQINTLFRHFVQVCELNQNLRRMQMIRKQKF